LTIVRTEKVYPPKPVEPGDTKLPDADSLECIPRPRGVSGRKADLLGSLVWIAIGGPVLRALTLPICGSECRPPSPVLLYTALAALDLCLNDGSPIEAHVEAVGIIVAHARRFRHD